MCRISSLRQSCWGISYSRETIVRDFDPVCGWVIMFIVIYYNCVNCRISVNVGCGVKYVMYDVMYDWIRIADDDVL